MAIFSRFRWWGLRLKILVWSFVPTALALVAVGLVSFYAFQMTTRSLLIERNRELVRLLAAQLANDMEEYTEILSTMARYPGFAGGTPAAQQAILRQAANSLAIFDGGVVVIDAHGLVTATQPERPQIMGEDWSGHSYFGEMMRSLEPVFSNIVLDGPGGTPAIVIAQPVFGPQDEFLGLIAGMFRLGSSSVSSLYGNIVKLRIGESEAAHLSTYLVDGKGQVVFHTSGEHIGQDFSPQQPVQQLLARNFASRIPGFTAGQQNFSGDSGTLRTRDVAGRDVVAYYTAVPGTRWGLVAESSWSGLLSYYRSYLFVQSLLFVLGVFLPAVLVNYGIRRVTEPVYRLIAGAKQVAGGNFGQEIQVKTGDELEELVHQFNHMSHQLSQSYAALREREERLALVMEGTNDGIWDWNIQTGQVYFSPRWKSMLGYREDEIVDSFDAWLDLIHPEDVETARQAIWGHLEGDQALFELEHRLKHKDGGYLWILDRGILLRDESGRPLRMVGSHSDLTQRRKAEEDLRQAYATMEERVEQRTRYLAALNGISALVNRSLDIEQTLNDALDKLLEITRTDLGVAYRLEGDRENEWLSPGEVASLTPEHLFLNPLVCRGLPPKTLQAAGRQPLCGNGIEGLIHSEAPLVWDLQAVATCSPVGAQLQQEGMAQVVSIPLKVKAQLIGVIQLGLRRGRTFSPEELDLLSAIGQQVGVSAENARLHQAVQQTAALEERSRLARELHDSVTQSLYSVTLLAEAATRLLTAGDTETAADHLRELRDAAQESLREMRLLIYELRPVALEKSGLVDALRLRLEAVEARSGIKSELRASGEERLTYELKTELYQIAQESLNNILKHAHASKVQIDLQFAEQGIRLEIQDDGVGFDLQAAAGSGGLGLAGIAERAKKIGASLQVDSSPGRGASIRVELVNPVSAQAGMERIEHG